MKQVCAWCGKPLSTTESLTEIVSHGVCEECAGRLLMDFHRSLAELVCELAEPVMAAVPEPEPAGG